MNHSAEKHAYFQTFGTYSNLGLLVFARVQPSSGNSQQLNECLELVPSACDGLQCTMQHPWARTSVRSNKEAGLVPASWLPSSGPVPAGSSPAHRPPGLPQRQSLTGLSQHQLCNTTQHLRLIFYGSFPPYVLISSLCLHFILHTEKKIHICRYIHRQVVLHESRSTLVITSLPAVPFSHFSHAFFYSPLKPMAHALCLLVGNLSLLKSRLILFGSQVC